VNSNGGVRGHRAVSVALRLIGIDSVAAVVWRRADSGISGASDISSLGFRFDWAQVNNDGTRILNSSGMVSSKPHNCERFSLLKRSHSIRTGGPVRAAKSVRVRSADRTRHWKLTNRLTSANLVSFLNLRIVFVSNGSVAVSSRNIVLSASHLRVSQSRRDEE